MIRQEIAFRYSKAIFNLSSSKEELEKRLLDLEKINDTIIQKPFILRFFSSPQIRQEQKEKVLKRGFEKEVDRQVFSFLGLLLLKQQFHHLPDIVKEYRRRVDEALGVLEVQLITAYPMNEGIKEKLKLKLEKSYHSKVRLQEELNPQLIGGGILVIGNQLLDFSIRGKLDRLKKELLRGCLQIHNGLDSRLFSL